MDTGHLIAMNVTLLYIILGPLVLFALYVVFDVLSQPGESETTQQYSATDAKDPALWTDDDSNAHLDRC